MGAGAVKVDVSGLDRLKAVLTPERYRPAMRAGLEAAALVVRGAATAKAPRKTGSLKRSHTHRVYDDRAEVGVGEAYGIFVHMGTGPAVGHKAYFPPWTPRTSLSFPAALAISKAGTKPNPWLAEAADESEGAAGDAFTRAAIKTIEAVV